MIDDDLSFENIKKHYPNATLKNINEYINMIFEKENCKKCKGLNECKNSTQGMVLECENDSFYYKNCKYRKQNELKLHSKSKIAALFLPEEVLNASLDSYNLDCESRIKIINHVKKMIDEYDLCEKRKGLYMYGSFAIGKTYTLSVIANMLAEKNLSSMLIYFPDFVSNLKANIGDSLQFIKIIESIRTTDFLLLDDLGAENLTPWVRDEILGPIINYRLMENKPIFITSNVSPNELKTYLSIDKSKQGMLKAERIMARLTDLVNTINMDDSERYSR